MHLHPYLSFEVKNALHLACHFLPNQPALCSHDQPPHSQISIIADCRLRRLRLLHRKGTEPKAIPPPLRPEALL